MPLQFIFALAGLSLRMAQRLVASNLGLIPCSLWDAMRLLLVFRPLGEELLLLHLSPTNLWYYTSCPVPTLDTLLTAIVESWNAHSRSWSRLPGCKSVRVHRLQSRILVASPPVQRPTQSRLPRVDGKQEIQVVYPKYVYKLLACCICPRAMTNIHQLSCSQQILCSYERCSDR